MIIKNCARVSLFFKAAGLACGLPGAIVKAVGIKQE